MGAESTQRSLKTEVVARLHDRLAELATLSDDVGQLTRWFQSDAMRRVQARFSEWGGDAGLEVSVDAVGNLRLRWRPDPSRTAPSLLVMGSHLDTVRNAGRYDGALGVLSGLACLEQLQHWGEVPPFDIEVVGFADEEGLRFQTAYLGSAYYAGVFSPEWLTRTDATGVSMEAVLSRSGRPAAEIPADQRAPEGLRGYLELHIEQGPQLEVENRAVGVVSAIAAQTRARLMFSGQAGHAGTTPMNLRRDALCAAAEAILAIEAQARSVTGLRATVGQVAIEPGASNVIPEGVSLSLDIRHADHAILATSIVSLREVLKRSTSQRGIELIWEMLQEGEAVSMDAELTANLRASAESRQGSTPTLVSGAGHDAVVMARVCPVAMVFVRCRGGLSHHPDEYASPVDMELGLAVLTDAVCRLAHAGREPRVVV